MLNLLTEKLIRFDPPGQPRAEASLPEVYAALLADRVEAFPALRPHQRHAWHAFLVQLGAMALHQAGRREPPPAAGEWQELLRALTPNWPNDEPWQLVVDDITQPAFMQPPARAQERLADYKSAVNTPDELDVLVTSKNHDLKSSVAVEACADDWLYALIALQTLGGYSAAGSKAQYHTISRVNGASGSRLAFSLTPSARPGPYFQRDIAASLEQRPELLGKFPMVDSGHKLLWTLPWDGVEALQLDALDPLYIEICRRVRLWADRDGGISAGKTGTKSPRINAKELRGVVGDLWMPVRHTKNGDVALRLTQSNRFGFKQISSCLDPADCALPPVFQTVAERRAPREMVLVARGVVSYSGRAAGTETRGYEERIIPLSAETIRILGTPVGPASFGEIAKSRVGQIATVRDALRDAIVTIVLHGENIYDLQPKKLGDLRRENKVTSLTNRLDEIVDNRFFADLQTEFEAAEDERAAIRRRWLKNDNDGVIDHASNILKAATESLPCPSIYRYKARVRAESIFWGRLRGANGLPAAFDNPDKENEECPNSNPPQPTLNPPETQMPMFP